jgi:hypothetical protein
MGLKKETQNTVLKGMKQNKVKPLNAGQKREQLKSIVDSLLAGPKSVKLEVIKLLVDSL